MRMCNKVLAIVFIVIALLLALLASVLPQDKLVSVIYISRFFDIMLPVLAVGALIKYLWTHRHHCSKCHHETQQVQGPKLTV
jgi:hypothetical protein